MKKITVIDILPTIFGLTAIAVLFGGWDELSYAVGLMGLAFFTALLSVVIAKQQHTLRGVHVINYAWTSVGAIILIIAIWFLVSFSHIHWTF
jgi:hypothetical protein